jgi:hypothetical protein
MKRFLAPCVLATTCALGCSSADTATEADYDDVAQALSSVIATDNGGGDVGSMKDSASIASGAADLGLSIDASGKFKGSHLGLDYQYAVQCSGADGSAMTKCDRTTDNAKVDVKWSGNLDLPHVTATVDRDGSWMLSKLQTDAVIFAGKGDFALDLQLQSIFRNVTRNYHVSYSADYAGVTFDRTAKHLTGGTVKYVVDAERMVEGTKNNSDATFHMDGLLTFSADGSAKLTLDETHAYKIDTASGTVTKQ